jgi:hypothetical protein
MNKYLAVIILAFTLTPAYSATVDVSSSVQNYDASCDFITKDTPTITLAPNKILSNDCAEQVAKTSSIMSFLDDIEKSTTTSIFKMFKEGLDESSQSPQLVYFRAAFYYAGWIILILGLVYSLYSLKVEIVNAATDKGFFGSSKKAFGKSLVTKFFYRLATLASSGAAIIVLIVVALSIFTTALVSLMAVFAYFKSDNDTTIQSQMLVAETKKIDEQFKGYVEIMSCSIRQDTENLWQQIETASGYNGYKFEAQNSKYLKCMDSGNTLWKDDADSFTPEYLKSVKYCADKELKFATQNCGVIKFDDETVPSVRNAFAEIENDVIGIALDIRDNACFDSKNDKNLDASQNEKDCMEIDPLSNYVNIANEKFVARNNVFHSDSEIRSKINAAKQKIVVAAYAARMTVVNNYVQPKMRAGFEGATPALLGESAERTALRNSAAKVSIYNISSTDERQANMLESMFSSMTEKEGQKSEAQNNYLRIQQYIDDYTTDINASQTGGIIENMANGATNNFFMNMGYSRSGCLNNECPEREFNTVSALASSSYQIFKESSGAFAVLKMASTVMSMSGTKDFKRPNNESTGTEQILDVLSGISFGSMLLSAGIVITLIMMMVGYFFKYIVMWLLNSMTLLLFFPMRFLKKDRYDSSASQVFKPMLSYLDVLLGPVFIGLSVFMSFVITFAIVGVFNYLYYYFMLNNGLFASASGDVIGAVKEATNLLIYYGIVAYIVLSTFKSCMEFFTRSIPDALHGSQNGNVQTSMMSESESMKHSLEKASSGFSAKTKRY